MLRTQFRIGQIVPSSNTTMETEIPAMLGAREGVAPERFSFHSARMRMKHVTQDELAKMDTDSDRCAFELSDARVDVLGYACLVAIMSMGRGYHRVSEQRLRARTLENDAPAPVVTSAGALVEGLQALGAKKIALLAPYMKPLTARVVDYIEHEGIEVQDAISLEISDNLEVGARDPQAQHRQLRRGGHLGVRADALAGFGAAGARPHRAAGGVVGGVHHLAHVESVEPAAAGAECRRAAVGPLLKARAWMRCKGSRCSSWVS
jgi:maleate isomerase